MTSTTTAAPRRLGASGPTLRPFALGCMGMSGMYGPSDDSEGIRTIHAALEAGVTLLDTGDFYGVGHNEMLIRRALDGRREQALLSVKFGALRSPDGGWTGFDGRPAAVKNFLAYSLARLGVDHIDIYRPGRVDPNVPIEDTIGAIADMVQAGYVRMIGLSEVGAETIRRAHAVHPITDLQIEYSLVSRGPEAAIFPVLQELGIGCTAYGVLSRGLLSGSSPAGPTDFRAYLPRFGGDASETNKRVVAELAEFASSTGHTVSQLAIAWVLQQRPFIISVIGSRRVAQLTEALGALSVVLTDAQRTALESIASVVAGTRYDANHMRALDSEK
jgi:aryl-alcohol dehydrogenase-like predicted oxidoreductase